MGMIRISVDGSFGKPVEKTFSAMTNGHADCVAQAIEYLAGDLLPEATALDHELHADNAHPEQGFRRKS